jgi:hypothetical protein
LSVIERIEETFLKAFKMYFIKQQDVNLGIFCLAEEDNMVEMAMI